MKIQEKFLTFVDVTDDTSGENLSNVIQETLSSLSLNLQNLRGQCYDGAGSMAGRVKGVGPRIQSEYPKAVHVWCSSHKLNLVVVAASKVPPIRNMQDVTDQAVRFFNNSPKREACLANALKECDKPVHKLKELCKARWVQRHIA